MKNIQYAIPFLAAILLVPGMAFAQTTPGNSEDEITTPYTVDEIYHSFAVMEQYVIYDENKNITFDLINATRDNVSQIDIDVALDFAIHSNDIINIVIGPTGQVDENNTDNEQLELAIQELKEGKFSALFGENMGSVGNVNDVTFTDYRYAAPIISAFGVSEYEIHKTGLSNILLACGGNFLHPHPEPPDIIMGYYHTEDHAIVNLLIRGYHVVEEYATTAFPHDYAKVIDAYNCNDGPFRLQAIVQENGNHYVHSTNSAEPNPEILNYDWPVFWWGGYVAFWHSFY